MAKELPNEIPIFPLTGVIMFPNTYLPLNIFEDRYIKMFNKALASEHKVNWNDTTYFFE